VMFTGVGIIASMASILASVLIPTPESDAGASGDVADLQRKLDEIHFELQALRGGRSSGNDSPPT